MQKSLKDLLFARQIVTQALRTYLWEKHYVEADVPVLVPSLIPESYLEVFETTVTDPNQNTYPAYLTASPEAYLKRLLSMGVDSSIFYLGKAFRNGEPLGNVHNHEFTLLEWYKLGADYCSLMDELENMFKYTVQTYAKAVKQDLLFAVDIPFERITIHEAFERFVPTQYRKNNSPEQFEKMYVEYIEPHMGTRGVPTFLIDFPTWQSPLAKEANGIAQRFELYFNGLELVNGWTELTDWKKQERNLKQENNEREKRGKEKVTMDIGFIRALKNGLPNCAGAAMGVDRLLMLLMKEKNLQHILPFSTKSLFS
ncbi:MAG: hypothetical protein NUV65_02970 [Candidatus Roizmanbacteria bacterium]|nr:hypothetical protein [Candidatus Roizmanbacteria bacterium]